MYMCDEKRKRTYLESERWRRQCAARQRPNAVAKRGWLPPAEESGRERERAATGGRRRSSAMPWPARGMAREREESSVRLKEE